MNTGTAVALRPVDISGWAAGNTGTPYVTSLDSGRPGPHVVVNALTHGNEVCGAHALAFLFEHRLRPTRGRLTLSFANVDAYLRFDPARPAASRFLDEDFNRLWSPAVLDGPRQSRELTRARELRPLIESADFLLDIHSMQNPSPALMLCGLQAKGRRLAAAVGCPAFVVADAGHPTGVRMRDYGAFADERSEKTALLVECGQHWELPSRDVAIETTLRFLKALDVVDPDLLRPHLPTPPQPQKLIEVTAAVAIASDRFAFSAEYTGLEVIPTAGTAIGHDGEQPVLTPYDNCVLIMPTRRLQRGQTAVRFGRFVA